MTIEEFLQEIIRVFKKVGIENAEGEARMLAGHVLSCDDAYLFLHQNEEIDDKVLLASAALINERTKGRPIQYIIGKSNFYGLEIAVDERVLIPRPETEILVDEALKCMRSGHDGSDNKIKVLDLCCGSGCIAAAVAANCSFAEITASDLSLKAYMLAKYNLRPYAPVRVVHGDLFENAADTFDYILSNPPYIPAFEIQNLQKEVRDFEPLMALNGGNDGLEIVFRIFDEAWMHLSDSGKIFMEIGHDQAQRCIEYAKKCGNYANIAIIKDLEGHDRIFTAEKNKKA